MVYCIWRSRSGQKIWKVMWKMNQCTSESDSPEA